MVERGTGGKGSAPDLAPGELEPESVPQETIDVGDLARDFRETVVTRSGGWN